MSSPSSDFIFCNGLPQVSPSDHVARIPGGIVTRDQLFSALSRELRFPAYFGQNWDALWDCLCDLSWIECRRVIIAHEAIPDLDAPTLRVYLELLAQCRQGWKPDEQHELVVTFPETAECIVRRIGGQALENP
jgi:RNAse (barnase) inhibitor barstar